MVIVWAQLDLTLREGSRSRNRFSGIAGGSNATIVGEGPIGRTERGAWLIALRQSFLEWPTEAEQSSRTAFGFSDGIAKLVDDLRPDHQLSLGVLAGRAAIDGDDNPVPEAPGAGTSATSVVNLAWRAALGPRLVINQRAYIVDHSFVNKHQTGEDRDRGASEEIVYRADVLRPVAGGLLEAGARAGRTAIHDAPGSSHAGSIAGSSWLRSGYAHFSWAVTPRITLSPGVRISQSTLLPHPAVTRWLLSEWTFPRRWTLTASAGISRQSPELRHVLPGGGLDLRPERATHVDVGLTRRESESLRWQATVFTREEADILREPDVYPRLVDDVIVPPDSGRYVNALGIVARGRVARGTGHATGLSGWAAYSFGRSRQRDQERGEAFWSDFDQRHTLSVFAVYRFSSGAAVGATFRTASNLPVRGYFEHGTDACSWRPAATASACRRTRVWTFVPIASSSTSGAG